MESNRRWGTGLAAAGEVSRILLVEDDEGIGEVLCYQLRAAGHEVWEARDGVSGLSLARERLPDLVLLDHMLPDLSGIEVCRRLRRSSDTPVIMLTARDAEYDRAAALEAGVDGYIRKPFSIRDLLAAIATVLSSSPDAGEP